MNKKHVLITGVAGFIGSNLLDFLLENTDWHVTGIDNFSTGRLANISHQLNNKNFDLVGDSLFHLKTLKPYDTVFHLAALPRIQPSFELVTEHIRENLLAAMHLLELMIADNHFPRLINSSSSAIYGTPLHIPTREDERIDCLSPYAFQKYETEKYFDLLSTRYPLDFVHLRYFNPYGPRSFNPANQFNAYSSVVGIFLYRKSQALPLLVTGDGAQQRDFIHVKDLARANFMAAEHLEKLNTAFNIGNSGTMRVIDMAHLISDQIEFIPKREGEADITYADVEKSRTVLNWTPTEKLEDFIQQELLKQELNAQ